MSGVNLLQILSEDGLSHYHIAQKHRFSLPSDATEVKVVDQHFLCLLTGSDKGELVQLPENIVINNTKLYSSSK